ncbi:hypothetical protein BpHYR1_034462, partial [Brachionus plicatilis]
LELIPDLYKSHKSRASQDLSFSYFDLFLNCSGIFFLTFRQVWKLRFELKLSRLLTLNMF